MIKINMQFYCECLELSDWIKVLAVSLQHDFSNDHKKALNRVKKKCKLLLIKRFLLNNSHLVTIPSTQTMLPRKRDDKDLGVTCFPPKLKN